MEQMLVNIKIEEIFSHPENPRKNIGDVSELADSMKKKGIMQNLTVMPGHYENEDFVEGGYTLLIGHRRCAAAKLAGIEEVPCKVVEGLSMKEQVSIMLEENMQRSDLTIFEQAQGFQMMLDLGETEESIAEKTGFSKTTVKRRLNIAKLDQEELKKKQDNESFQLTLTDLYALEKVEDIETRNKILREASSSRDIVWKAESAVKNAQREKVANALIEKIEALGIEKAPDGTNTYSGKWESVTSFSLEEEVPEEIDVKVKEGTKRCYLKQWREIVILKKTEKKAETKEDVEKKEKERKKKEIKAIVKEIEARRRDFVESIIEGKIPAIKEDAAIKEEIWRALISLGASIYEYNMREFFSGETDCKLTAEEKEVFTQKIRNSSMIHQMLIVLHRSMKMTGEIVDYSGYYDKKNADKLYIGYTILEKYGWSFEAEEKQIMDGTHELYAVKEDNDSD